MCVYKKRDLMRRSQVPMKGMKNMNNSSSAVSMHKNQPQLSLRKAPPSRTNSP